MTHNLVNPLLQDVLRFNFAGITRANFLLENKDNIEFEGKDKLIAEAKFLRAYYYFELVKVFGAVPLIVDRRIGIEEATSISRTPASEVYAQIEQDLLDAAEVLDWTDPEKGRVTKGAALGLLGRAYLYQDKFDQAAAVLDEVINDGPFSTITITDSQGFSDLFSVAEEGNTESVFEIEYTGLEGGSYDCFVCLEGNVAVGFNGPYQYEGPVYRSGNRYNVPTQDLYDFYDPSDLRRDGSILDIEAFKAAQPNPDDISYTPGAGGHTGYYNNKYIPRQSETGLPDVVLTSPVNHRVIRYPDVLLMAAEAHNRKASPDDVLARTYLNEVRNRVGMGDITSSGTDLTNAIWAERRLELAGEGLRFFDLVRTGQAASAIDGFVAGKHELFPIPQVEIDLAGGNWEQNPMYQKIKIMIMMKSIKTIILIIPVLLLLACQEEFELTETPPTTEDGTIGESTEGTEGPNYVLFTNNSDGFMKKWDFGNGTTGEGDQVTAYYPFAGEYTVTLTVFTKGGSVTTTQVVTIDETDPEICNVEVLQLLTGGCGVAEGKTWVIDKERAGHFGLGPVSSFGPDWYQAGANEKAGGGMYDDEFTFYLNQSVAVVETNGDVFLNGGQQSNFPGATSAVGDYTAPYTAPEGMNYSVTTDGEGNNFLNLTKGGFIGYATGVSTYQIMSITANEMFLRFTDRVNGEFAWYLRLIRKGYAPVVADYAFEVDGGEVTFTNRSLNATTYEWDFGDGNTSSEENPVHTYAGDGIYQVKMTASATGESKSVTKEVTIALDAITVLTEELLTGGGSKAWKLKPAANAFGIGPSKGSPEWYPGWGVDISGDRPCLFNDQFIFSTGNVFEYDALGDIFGEGYMGLSDGCQDEANLTGDAAPWASGTHTYTFTPATDVDPATIAVTGTGAFIVLPKAYNGGEYASAPPDTDATVTYEVLSYNKVGSDEELALTISIGGGYWNFVLIPAE